MTELPWRPPTARARTHRAKALEKQWKSQNASAVLAEDAQDAVKAAEAKVVEVQARIQKAQEMKAAAKELLTKAEAGESTDEAVAEFTKLKAQAEGKQAIEASAPAAAPAEAPAAAAAVAPAAAPAAEAAAE